MPDPAAAGSSATAFTGTSYQLRGPSGTDLAVRVWETNELPHGLVLISHGYGEHSGRYQHVATALTAAGYLVVAPDHAGHGRSGGPRGIVDFERSVADLDAVLDSQAEIHPTLKRFVLGHSFGGALALRYAITHQHRLSGLILSGPLVRADANPVQKLLASLLARIAPGAPAVRLDPKLVSRDPAVVAAYEVDPLVRHAPIPAGTGAQFIRHASTIFEDADEITIPTLLLWGTADGLCPPAGAEQLARSLGSPDLTLRSYDGLYHEIFNEPERDETIGAVLEWLNAHS